MENIIAARPEDISSIIEIWHAGWHEAHAALVPEAILDFREIRHFWLWLECSTGHFFVALRDDAVVGFVTTNGPELEKLYVAARARGTGTAAALLAFGERRIASSGVTDGVLYCTAGNIRAQKFYICEGWTLRKTYPDTLWLPADAETTAIVDTHRFEKQLV